MQFARRGEQRSGVCHAADLPRLEVDFPGDRAAVQYRLGGAVQAGRPALELAVQARVVLRCERCLEPFVVTLELHQVYPLARDEAELARWEREDPLLEALVAEPRMDVIGLVEDEILLSLPAAPRHPDGECQAPGWA